MLGDRLAEENEYFSVNLTSATNGGIADGSGTGYIYDNEPQIWIDDVAKREGTGKGKHVVTTQFIFTVHLSQAYDEAVTVNFATANGSATLADGDYNATSGSVTIAAGQTTGTITVTVKGDNDRENDEYFMLNLTPSTTNALLVDNQALGWILDDDRRGRK